jgi:hypothetical protein
MYYRVVMQGRTVGGADLEEVKRNFVRVTGLPMDVAEGLFGGMPQVVKRQVQESDAERIAATLRAIGAAATVEREVAGAEEETTAEIRIIASPLNNGPPTIIAGADPSPTEPAAASPAGRWLRKAMDKGPLVLGGVVLVAGAVLIAPLATDYLSQLSQPATPPAAKTAPALAAASAPVDESAAPLNATLLQGPWRCTDQRTGLATYWSYTGDGALIHHGEALTDRRAPPAANASLPNAWKLEARRLVHSYAARAADTYTVENLSLTRLRYGNDRGLEIECRRP